MLFSSFEFLYLFLPVTVALYFLSPSRARNYVLLVTSLVFYGFAAPKFLPLMIGVALIDWGFGLLVWRYTLYGKERVASATVAVAVATNVAILALFKYLGPTLALLGIGPVGIELPPGISFYIFQALSYVLDVKRQAARAQKNPFIFVTYVSLFPQLVAGPIVRYCDVDEALEGREHSVTSVADGLRLFSVGLAKKVLLANGAGDMWERMKLLSGRGGTTLGAWLGVLFFAFQIYFDFSGYSDMAMGLGRVFGLEFPDNFRYPYISKSITEFWRRWHVTLSSWFREYVYIPLGGNRRGRARTYLNLLVVWTLTGIWHGASVNFLLWGLYFFVLLTLEKMFLGRLVDKLPSVFGHAYALFFILIGWLIFAADGIGDVGAYALQMMGIGSELFNNDALYELSRSIVFIAILAIGSTPVPSRLMGGAAHWLKNAWALVLLALSTCYLADAGYNPFLYFRF